MTGHTHDVDDVYGLRRGLTAAQQCISDLGQDTQRLNDAQSAPAVPTTEEWERVRKAVEGLQSDIGRVWKYARGLEDRVARLEREHESAEDAAGGAA